MNFNDIFRQLLKAPDPLSTFVQIRDQTLDTTFNRVEIVLAVAALSDSIERRRLGRALTAARSLLILAGPKKMIDHVRRIRALRASRQKFHNPTVEALIADWTNNSVLYGLSQAQQTYLQSVAALWSLAPEVKLLQHSLVRRLKAKQPFAVKTLLAVVDVAFAYDKQADHSASTDTMGAYTAECLAQAFSFLLSLYQKEVGLSPNDMAMVDEASTRVPDYDRLLVDAAKICEYLEAELLIEGFPYLAIEQSGVVSVQSIDPTLERSVRMGYIQTEFQQTIRSVGLSENRNCGDTMVTSMSSLAQEFASRFSDRFVKLVSVPVPRYVITLPFEGQIRELFASDDLFLEDIASLDALGAEDYIDPLRVMNLAVIGDIEVLDIIKVQRFFYFLQHCLKYAIDHHSPTEDRPLLYLISCIPVFKRMEFLSMIEMIVGAEKAQSLLSLLTSDLTLEYMDLQYAPVISVGEWCMMSIAVASLSNLVRNILCHADKRLEVGESNKNDPMELALVAALRGAGFLVSHNQDLGTKNNPLETDIVAYRDGHLFLFECKNGFHPCNVYELRNSYDHIVKGTEQLHLRKQHMSMVGQQRALFVRLGWNIARDIEVHTCIVVGNRVFNGYSSEGHPVRQAHELLNLLNKGTINLNHTIYRLWKNESFSVCDLCAYLDGSIIIEEFIQAMEPMIRYLDFGKHKLSIASYVLDSRPLMVRAQEKYQVVQ